MESPLDCVKHHLSGNAIGVRLRTLKREQMVVVGKTRERIPQTRDSRKKVPAVFPQMSTASTICQTGVAAAPRAKDGHSMPMQGKEAVAL